MNKEVLINPKTGKPKKCWSLDVQGLLENGWVRQGCEVETKNKQHVKDEPEQDPKPTYNKKAK